MSETEAIEKLAAMRRGDDEELSHAEADKILCNFLEAQGFADLAKAFDDACGRVGFWYA